MDLTPDNSTRLMHTCSAPHTLAHSVDASEVSSCDGADGVGRVEFSGDTDSINQEPSTLNHLDATAMLSGEIPEESLPISSPETAVPSVPLSAKRVSDARERQARLDTYYRLRQGGMSTARALQQAGISRATVWRWEQRLEGAGFDGLMGQQHKSGRKPEYLPTEDELACVRTIYVQLDESVARGRGLGSSRIAAYRIAAKNGDPRISQAFKDVVLKPRTTKSVPPSWMRLLDTPASVLDANRDSRSTQAYYVNTPRGRTYIAPDGQERPLKCGTIFESDDGTLNFYCWVPWPFGGDPCSEKFGVKLGRWQFLPVVDVHSEMCLTFDVVARNAGSYRGEDSRAILGRTMFDVATPETWRLERGAWESQIVRDALQLAHVPVFNAWHSKQKSAIERFFDRMWTPLSLIPGHVGRDQSRFKQITNLALACQQGRRDPREAGFLSLEEAMPKIAKAVEFVNSEPIVSNAWGKWEPQARWEAAVGSNQSSVNSDQTGRSGLNTDHCSLITRLDPSLRVFFAREQRVWTVRGCCMGGRVEGPQVRFPVYFQTPELYEFEGCKVRAYFDPYEDGCPGTLVLEEDAWRGYRRGHIIASGVPALDLPPQAVLADEWNDDESRKQLALRKAISKAVRTEKWNWLGQRSVEVRDGLGNSAVKVTRNEERETRNEQPATRNLQPATPRDRSASILTAPSEDEFSKRRARLARMAEASRELEEMAST